MKKGDKVKVKKTALPVGFIGCYGIVKKVYMGVVDIKLEITPFVFGDWVFKKSDLQLIKEC